MKQKSKESLHAVEIQNNVCFSQDNKHRFDWQVFNHRQFRLRRPF